VEGPRRQLRPLPDRRRAVFPAPEVPSLLPQTSAAHQGFPLFTADIWPHIKVFHFFLQTFCRTSRFSAFYRRLFPHIKVLAFFRTLAAHQGFLHFSTGFLKVKGNCF
jgi:hypothetical protein